MMIQATTSAPTSSGATTLVDQHYQALARRLQNASVSRNGEDASSGDHSSPGIVGTIGITSSRRGEGVSTVAANLALAAAEMSLGPVLLVDANLPNPDIAGMFRIDPATGDKGLIDALLGEDHEDLVVETSVANLSVMLPGVIGKNRQLLNERHAIQQAIQRLREDYEWIIFDLPPATELSECFALSGQLDSVLVVVQADGPPRETVRRACRELEIAGAKVVGAVLNQHK